MLCLRCHRWRRVLGQRPANHPGGHQARVGGQNLVKRLGRYVSVEYASGQEDRDQVPDRQILRPTLMKNLEYAVRQVLIPLRDGGLVTSSTRLERDLGTNRVAADHTNEQRVASLGALFDEEVMQWLGYGAAPGTPS